MDNLRTKQEQKLHDQIEDLDVTPEQADDVVGGFLSEEHGTPTKFSPGGGGFPGTNLCSACTGPRLI
jgi:hypothetical protein